jgi:hypothetical protein
VVLVQNHDAHEMHQKTSPASSITKLGIVRFVIAEATILPNEEARSSGIIELLSFGTVRTSRPTKQMPRVDACESPATLDEALGLEPDEVSVVPPAPAPAPMRMRISMLLA